MKKGTRFLVELFIILSLFVCGAQATTQADVTITTDIVAQEGQTILSGNVMVEFHNLALYNDQIKLSWHIYTAEGELLVFENQRYPFSLQNGCATIPVNIDLAALALPQGEISIRFDLVDEENLYWFNDHPECVVDAAELRWQPTELSTPSSKVTITSNMPDIIYQKKLSGAVQVHFDDPALYSDQVKLSWHLYTEAGDELLFENQRLPLTYADGVATAPVEIDLGTVEAVSNVKSFVLRFDLVDEQDAFWFSQSDSVTLEGGQVTYQHNFIRELRAVFHNVLTKQTFLLVLNLIVDATVIAGAIYWWKRRKTAKPNAPPPTTRRSESGAPSVLGKKRGEWGYLLVAALLGACVFVLIYGWKVLNPFYVDWLVVYGGDTAQHYVGWELFRSSGWQFPFGMTDAVMYPFQTSIVFTDSIPILAIIFKLLLHSIQTPFQYFGWWGIVCFMLQAGIAASILKKYTGKAFACIASLLFVLAPIMLLRMYAHTALAGQWLILLSVHTIVYYDEKYCDMKRAARRFALIGALTVAVHIYLTAICSVLVCGFALLCWLKQRRVKDIFICLGSYIIPAAVTFYLLGGFFLMGTGDGEALFGLGFYSFNLNAFWNPFGWSSLLPAAPTYTEGQYEGCAYLGVGVLFALVCAVVISAILWARKHKNHIKNDKRDFLIAALVTATVLVVVSLSNSISFNETLLLHYPLPSFLVKIISIFRCTGRFIWPVVYALMIWALCTLYRQKKLGFVLLGLTLVLQVVDLSPRLADKHVQFAEAPAANVTMQSDIWDKLVDSGQYRHIAFVSKIADFEAVNTLSTPLYGISSYAAQNGMTVNDFYIGRIPDEMRQHAYMMPLEDVLTDTAYVFYDSDRILCGQYPFYYNLADGLIVGTVDPVEGGDNLRGNDPLFQEYSQSFTNQQYLTNGSDVDGRRYIYQRGVSYGPYISLEQGQYAVTITGENLTSADLFCYAGYGSELFNLENTQTADSEVSYIVTFDHDVKDIEFVVQNNRSERAIVLDSVRVARMLG